MKGRTFFRFSKPVLFVIVFIINCFPLFIRKFFYDVSMCLPTILGVATRYVLLKSLCLSLGDNVYIGRWVTIKNFKNLTVGNNVSIHEYSYIDALGNISIGSDVSIAHNCSLISFEHSYGCNNIPIKYNKLIHKKILISDDVWLGCGVRVLAGSIIKRRVIIAANSVSKGILESDSIYAGTPAKLIKEL